MPVPYVYSIFIYQKQAAHLSSNYGTYSINNPDIKKPNSIGFPNFSCLVGISYIKQVAIYTHYS